MVLLALALLSGGGPLDGFAKIPAGKYAVGKEGRLDNPPRTVRLKAFEIAKTETTNAQFEVFVKATGYVTDAERFHDAMVFEPGLPEFRWIKDPTAYWRYPNGKSRGGIDGKERHPVTSISYNDAMAYCKWAKLRLPTLDEWEVASRAGAKTDYFFGSDVSQIGKYANVWHGRNHLKPDTSDGYMYTSPVGSFLPNPYGLYDIYGNVFEFCSGHLPSDKSSRTVHARGGSWWCSKNACCFFNSADIGSVDRRASFSNQGFRLAR
ncbi:MAG TPA: SUMF1/EgtB/PvdO family nonheme iron enzyme [Fimbriimonadaceae bacterium]|nr:SUMF1/EgtB/PvdO family nonheme iron enzyme [Fimbriimonadaceae bacterium]